MNLSIGLTGLRAAQKALELVGTNLSNASTDGYHRQEILLSPIDSGTGNSIVSVGGVQILGASRSYDVLLETENLRMQPQMGQISQELEALTTIEAALGTVDNDIVGDSVSAFFSALNNLAADPTALAYAQEVTWSADAMANNIRYIADFMLEMKEQVKAQAEALMGEVNLLSENIAKLNQEIEVATRRGISCNVLKDRRDQMILELAQKADVQISGLVSDDGQINVSAWGTPLVMGERAEDMEVGLNANNELGVGMAGAASYSAYADGGEIGALLYIYNEVIPQLESSLDDVASQLIYQINSVHVQGLGPDGSFSSLTGMPVNTTATMGNWWPGVSDGDFAIRITEATGNSTVYEVHVDDGQDIDYVVDQLNLLDPDSLQADVVGGKLVLQGLSGATFDFVPDYSDTAGATNELLTGEAVMTLQDDYFVGDDAGDTLTIALGSTAAEELTYVVGDGSKSLQTVVEEINAWSESVHAGWKAASVVYDESAGGFRLKLESYDLTGSGNITVANTGGVTWGDGATAVALGAGNFEASDAKAAFGVATEITGLYEGANDEFTVTVIHPDGAGNSGTIGLTDNLQLEVRNSAGELVTLLDVGAGYAALDTIEVCDGMEISLGSGVLTHGESFTVTARSDTDDSDFLVAAGMNTFFSGEGASDIDVREHFIGNPEAFATSVGQEGNDNVNVVRMAALQTTKLAELGNSTISEAYNGMLTDVGQMVAIRDSRYEALESIYQELQTQRDDASGVDPNEEAAKLLMFQQMFQSMSKYISLQSEMMNNLMDLL